MSFLLTKLKIIIQQHGALMDKMVCQVWLKIQLNI